MPQIISLGITLDGIAEYGNRFQTPKNALGLPPDEPDPVYAKAWPRFLALCARCQISASFFVIGHHIEAPVPVALSRETLANGHELGNRSYSAPVNFSHLSMEEIVQEIAKGEEAIYSATNTRPCGFSAPAHQSSRIVLRSLAARNYMYDASLLPLPVFYASLRAGANQVQQKLGILHKPSTGNINSAVAPSRPYRPSLFASSRRGNAPLLVLPISVLPWIRLPLSASLFSLLGEEGTKVLAKVVLQQEFLHILLGGADLLAVDEIPEVLRKKKRVFEIPLVERIKNIETFLALVREKADILTLEEAAHHFVAQGM